MDTLMDRISLYRFRRRWREKNRHNTTAVGKVFNIDKVYVGNYTYGTINCLTWGCGNEILKIGNLCSIAQEVMFILGADHHTNHVSSYPFKSKMQLGDGGLDANSKGNIIVGDDVWIGYRSTILSGVEIGKGAIISLISKEAADKCLEELYRDITEENVDKVVDTILKKCKTR